KVKKVFRYDSSHATLRPIGEPDKLRIQLLKSPDFPRAHDATSRSACRHRHSMRMPNNCTHRSIRLANRTNRSTSRGAHAVSMNDVQLCVWVQLVTARIYDNLIANWFPT